MRYETIHLVNERFQWLVFSVLFAAFLLALGLMFVHPTGSLVVFFAGLVFAGAAAVVERFFLGAEHRASRRHDQPCDCGMCTARRMH